MNIKKLFKAAAAPALLVASTLGTNAATMNIFTDGDFDFGAKRLSPKESIVAVQGVSETRDNGEYRACVMSTFKKGVMTAYQGAEYDAKMQEVDTPQEAFAALSNQVVPRSTYRADAQYIVVSESPQGEDFIRINGGAPLVEGEARVFFNGQEVSSEHIQFEYSERHNEPQRAKEAYTLHITDPATIENVKNALASQQEVQAIVRTVNSDFVVPLTFVGNTDLSKTFGDCLKNIDEMDIAKGTFPSWSIGAILSEADADVLALAAMFEDEDALANPGQYRISEILGTEGMFAVGPHALQKMMGGELVETSQGEYNSFNHLTGIMSVSPSMLQFSDHIFNSCSCALNFGEEDPFDFNNLGGGGSGSPVAVALGGGGFGGGASGGGGTGGSGGSTDEKEVIVVTPTPDAVVPLPSALLLLASGLGVLGFVGSRRGLNHNP